MLVLLASSAGLAQSHQTVRDGDERTISTWAPKGLMRSPVSICFDPKGNLYVAESDRAGNAVADTRGLGHLNAVEEDLQFKSIEDRRAQIHRWIAKGAFPADHFTKTEDRVRIVRDTDGDGVADWSGVFAGGFNDELDGIGAGVLWHDGALYYTCIPNFWKLTPGKDPHVAATREPLSTGYGVRWCFYGHDLHGAIEGPDGRLYFSMGDRGYNVTTKEGERIVGVDRGGVFRCWPDGSGLELFYEGLRNPQDLAFDDFGEMFTGDNNCDSGDLARVVYVVEGGDSGWRQDVQSLPSRGPWNREAIWKTLKDVSGPARPAWALPPVEYMGAGPSGILFNPGTGEGESLERCFFLVDFYGSGATVHAFRCETEGAFYRVADRRDYYKGLTITDIAWGYDGRFYMSDWGGGWDPNPNGVVLAIRNERVQADPAEAGVIREVGGLFREGFAIRGDDELMALLGHRDQRVRLAAQFEIARRGEGQIVTLGRVAAASASGVLARIHAIWALGQIARKEPDAAAALLLLLGDADAEVRAQAVRTLGDVAGPTSKAASARYVELLRDPSPRVRKYAALALGRIREASAVSPLLQMLAANDNKDVVIRHVASYALARIGRAEEMIGASASMNAAARLGAVVALRRMGHDGVTAFLHDADAGVAIEAARAIYDNRSKVGMPELAAMIDGAIPAGVAIEPMLRRAIEANVHLGDDACVERLARFAARSDVASEWRELALDRVAGWDKPLKREGVWGNWADYPARSKDAQKKAIRANIDAILAAAGSTGELKAKGERLKVLHTLDAPGDALVQELGDASKSEAYRLALLERLAGDAPAGLADACDALLVGGTGAGERLRQRSAETLATIDPARAVTQLKGMLASTTVGDRQLAVRLLATMKAPAANEVFMSLVRELRRGKVDGAIALELYEAAMKRPKDSEARTIAELVGKAPARPEGYATALLMEGGSEAKGRELFRHHASAECVRCHVVDDLGGTAGPNLTEVASRLTPTLLVESLLEPGKTVAAGFGQVTAMPVMSQFLSPREVRDVVAYLKTLKGKGAAAATPAARGEAHAAGFDAGAWMRRALLILILPVFVYTVWRGVSRRGEREQAKPR